MTQAINSSPTVYMVSGPNGAGKTTFAKRFLPDFVDCREFVNADMIAEGLSPFAPQTQAIRASQLMLERIRQLIVEHQTFALETTLAGRSYHRMIQRWRREGYEVKLFFLWLPSPELAVERVALRVREGGHDIPEPVIRRRFDRGIDNLANLFLPSVDAAYVYDASRFPPTLIYQQENDSETICDAKGWATIKSFQGNKP